MLLEKVTGSFISSVNLSFQTQKKQPSNFVLIADTLSANGWPIMRHFLSKSILDKNIKNVYFLCLENSQKHIETLAESSIAARSQKDSSDPANLVFINPTSSSKTISISNKSGQDTTFQYQDTDINLGSLSKLLVSKINVLESSVLFIDNLTPLISEYGLSDVEKWLVALQQSSLIHGLVVLVNADQLTNNISLHNPYDDLNQAPVVILDTLVNISTTFLQTLPVPSILPPFPSTSTHLPDAIKSRVGNVDESSSSKDCVCVCGVRILSKRKGKTVAGCEAVWVTRYGYCRGGLYNANDKPIEINRTKADEDSDAALQKLSHGLSFNVKLTDKQKQARDNVELPFANQGEAYVAHLNATSSTPVMSTGMNVIDGNAMLAKMGSIDDVTFDDFEIEEMDDDDEDDEI